MKNYANPFEKPRSLIVFTQEILFCMVLDFLVGGKLSGHEPELNDVLKCLTHCSTMYKSESVWMCVELAFFPLFFEYVPTINCGFRKYIQ